MIRCNECPRCKDTYPGKLDRDGYHFHICGVGGNIVYTIPHKIKRATGSGYISHGISSCGLYDTVEDALAHMTEAEKKKMAKVKRYPPTGFPERLEQIIYDRGMTKVSVAREIGVDRKSIISYTYGESTPDVTVLRRLCTVLNVSADYLIFGR